MEFSQVFYKEIPLDEDNIFSANLAENDGVEQVKFKKSKIYAISGLSIDQDTQPNVSLPNIEGKKALSDILRTYAEKKRNLTLIRKFTKKIILILMSPSKKEQMF